MLSSSAGLGLAFLTLTEKLATSEFLLTTNIAVNPYKNASRSSTLTPFCPILTNSSKAVYVEYMNVKTIYCSCQGWSLMINVNCFVCISQDICDDHPPFSSGSCKTDSAQPPHSSEVINLGAAKNVSALHDL